MALRLIECSAVSAKPYTSKVLIRSDFGPTVQTVYRAGCTGGVLFGDVDCHIPKVTTCAFAHWTRDQQGLTECFDFVVTADEVSVGKPDPAIDEIAARRFSLSPHHLLGSGTWSQEVIRRNRQDFAASAWRST